MATFATYYYFLGKTNKLNIETKDLKDVKEFFFTFEDKSKARFIILEKNEVIPIKHEEKIARNVFQHYQIGSVESFLKFLRSLTLPFAVGGVSEVEIDNLQRIYKKENVDWSKTIDYLEEKGLVKTKPTKSMLATDERKFWISEEKEDTAMDVDCLGMDLHGEITDKIREMYVSNF